MEHYLIPTKATAMVKKILMFLALTVGLTNVAAAQGIYGKVRSNAQTAVQTANSELVKQINQFKLDALDYLLIKMREQTPDSTTAFLDKQAYALNGFIAFYVQQIVSMNTMTEEQKVKTVQLFMDASLSNPLFNDADKELTQGYFTNPNSITRFSLDTDWRRAYAAVVAETEKLKGKN